jgi:HAD superfamily 5'-nucleotidase-like hydrolase
MYSRRYISNSTLLGVILPSSSSSITKHDHWKQFLKSRRIQSSPNVGLSSNAEYIEPVAKRYSAPLGSEVYANSGMNLAQIDVWGFDYDYTIACWGKATSHLIYNLGLEALLKKGYPKELNELKDKFDKDFVIRGLSYDRQTGFLLKLDQFGQIQLDSVFLGRRQLDPEEVKKAYSYHTRLSREYMHQNLEVCSDLFSIPEACLLADVSHFFETQGTYFHPSHLHQDVNNAVDGVHRSSLLHDVIKKDLPNHLEQDPLMGVFFERLRSGGKKVFLLSNSSYWFIDAGMRYLLQDFLEDRKIDNWLQLFDVTIVNAKKPSWYNKPGKFRKVDTETGALSIKPISKFVPGEVYAHGSLDEFHSLLGVQGDRVLYVGDQIYTDLRKLSLDFDF